MKKIKFISATDSQTVANAKLLKSLQGTLFRHGTEWGLKGTDWVTNETDPESGAYPCFKASKPGKDKQEDLFLSMLCRRVYNAQGEEVLPPADSFTQRCLDIYDEVDTDEQALSRILAEVGDKTLVVDRSHKYEALVWDRKNECWSDRTQTRTLVVFYLKA